VGQICCKNDGPVSGAAECYTPTEQAPSCPQGCAPYCVSDRDQKQDVVPADEAAVLERVASMPFATVGPPGAEHLASPIGDPIDAHGTSLAAIKALYSKLQQQQARLDELEARSRALRARLQSESTCHP